jgi:hypothetical protein
MGHTFHIPVLGLAFSADSPIKVARYGISSVMSIVDDELLERLRAYYCKINHIGYQVIPPRETDSRAKRITAYLNLVSELVHDQIQKLRSGSLEKCADLRKYFELLPNHFEAKRLFERYNSENDLPQRTILEKQLKEYIKAGDIDVNIMSKVDKANTDHNGKPLPPTFSDASAALRGFASSNLHSSLVISAGLNPRLFSYLAEFEQFLPDSEGQFNKKVVLKVSDYRSAYIQAKILAKKGIWISEYRIESGLNCGGHAFATEGYLMGPILEEFRSKRTQLQEELFSIYTDALKERNISIATIPSLKITAQGGIGNAMEQDFLLQYYRIDRTGWGSPFLLVPEATTVDDGTLQAIATASEEDFYVSESSPLGVPFNNFRKSTAEIERLERIVQGRPGAPCTKKYLVSNTEFTTEPICTASRKYQSRKIKEIQATEIPEAERQQKIDHITSKTCLCEGLAASAYLKYDIVKKKESAAVSICPGPNTAYFDREYSLTQMVEHIYALKDLLADKKRPHMFINELALYIEYLRKYVKMNGNALDNKKQKYINSFKNQLDQGIAYYANLKELHNSMCQKERDRFIESLNSATQQLQQIHTNL